MRRVPRPASDGATESLRALKPPKECNTFGGFSFASPSTDDWLLGSDVHVTWSASDPSPGSGVDAGTCLLEVREDEGAWQTFSTECGGDDTYDGQPGHTYTFRLSAADNVGNTNSLEVLAVVPYVTKYYYANGQRVALWQGDVVYYIHTDHLGSTSVLSNESGQQAGDRVAYLPYGGVRLGDASTLPTDYTFTGQRLEAGIGLMHYGARFYSPRLGRFVSADSIVPEPGEPQALNRYSYVYNNPLRYSDPSGHQGEEDCPPKLTPKQLEIVQRMAEEFGVPPELLAAVLNTERVYDTDWYDPIQDAYQDWLVFWAKAPDWTAVVPALGATKAASHAEMYVWEIYWKPGAKGVGPGIGLGHVHTGPAREVEKYFAERGLSDLLPAATASTELWGTLQSDEGNIRYTAAGVRRLLEIRQGGEWEYGQITTIDSLSTNDAELIMDGYWWGVNTPYGSGGYGRFEFQTATAPKHTNGLLIGCSYGYYQQ